jgi:hypothetical protein
VSIFKIEQAEREGARLVVGLGGVSGGGKTFTALQLAWGMANYDSSKVGFICTENRRGRLYSDALKDAQGKVHKFLIGDLTPPFSPQRYIEAINAFVKAGVEVLVIDSVSHEFEGIGGVEDIATAGNPKVPRWNDAKAQHKAFMNTLLQSPVHVIACMRAREKVKLVKQDGKTVFEPLGVQPIQEKSFTFELTASLMMWNEGKEQQVIKCPSELRSILGRERGYITAADGKALRDWVNGAQQMNPEVARARDSLQLVTEQGMQALQAAWAATPKGIKAELGAAFLEQLKKSAAEFDAQRRAASEGGADVANLNDQVLGNGAQSAA